MLHFCQTERDALPYNTVNIINISLDTNKEKTAMLYTHAVGRRHRALQEMQLNFTKNNSHMTLYAAAVLTGEEQKKKMHI